MHQQSNPKGRRFKPLFPIPVAIVIAKAMSHHRAGLDTASGEPGFRRRGPWRHGRFGPVDPATGEFRLPPRIEALLGDWHKRAHEAGEPDSVTV